ncbi:hypothetical protein V6N11_009287 [Hibiscus sabdariffa]|uniref:Uncharacterized protein n=2 Tax=Hibiscus sabdariffa TaxID=183260 RepID=A0ABR2PQB9_9ROSI
MADTTRQPTRSHVVPIIPQSADPITTRLDPLTPAMFSSPSSAFVPLTAPMRHDAPSPAFSNQPLVADYGSPSTKVMPNGDAHAEPLNTTTTLVDVPPDSSSSIAGPDQPSFGQHTYAFFNPAHVEDTAIGTSQQHVSNTHTMIT